MIVAVQVDTGEVKECPRCDIAVVVHLDSYGQYGHCATCHHTVFLGRYGQRWTHGLEADT